MFNVCVVQENAHDTLLQYLKTFEYLGNKFGFVCSRCIQLPIRYVPFTAYSPF